MDKPQLYDVLAVNIKTRRIRFIDRSKTLPNAEAVRDMAVMRRGVDVEFYVEVPEGAYAEGDTWRGRP